MDFVNGFVLNFTTFVLEIKTSLFLSKLSSVLLAVLQKLFMCFVKGKFVVNDNSQKFYFISAF